MLHIEQILVLHAATLQQEKGKEKVKPGAGGGVAGVIRRPM
jgi:hypothetical protein